MFDDLAAWMRLLKGLRALLLVAAAYALTLQPILAPAAIAADARSFPDAHLICAGGPSASPASTSDDAADPTRDAHAGACCCTAPGGQAWTGGDAVGRVTRPVGVWTQVAIWGQTLEPRPGTRRGPALPRAPPVA